MMHRTIHLILIGALHAGWGWGLRAQDTFPELQVGSIVYTNANVANRTATDVFIRYDGGFANLKVADLPPEVLRTLGYDTEPAAEETPRISLAKLQADPRIQAMQQKLAQHMEGTFLQMDQTKVAGIVVAMLLGYLFLCYCNMLICKNAGTEPGVLVWLPGLQIFPMLRAAGMPAWCALLFLVPGLNLVMSVVWCLKIAKACGKSVLVGVLLLLPIIGFFALIYLAFSGEREAEDALQPVKLKLSEG